MNTFERIAVSGVLVGLAGAVITGIAGIIFGLPFDGLPLRVFGSCFGLAIVSAVLCALAEVWR